MQRLTFPSASPASAVRRGSAIGPPWNINERLSNAERELRVQFTRIAQLQAQLDVVLCALQNSSRSVTQPPRRRDVTPAAGRR